MVKVRNLNGFIKGIRDHVASFEQVAVQETKTAARILQEEMFLRTPVWEGEAIRNFAWGIRSAPGGHKSPIGSGSTGRTSQMSLGEEPRRGANQAAVRAEMEGVLGRLKGRLQNLAVTNNSEIWTEIDAGSAPSSEQARNPGGVSRIALQNARSRLKNFS